MYPYQQPAYPSHFFVRLRLYNPQARCLRLRAHIGHPRINQLFKGGDGVKTVPEWYRVDYEQAVILSQFKQVEGDPYSPKLFDIATEEVYRATVAQEAVVRRAMLGMASPEAAQQEAMAAMYAAQQMAMGHMPPPQPQPGQFPQPVYNPQMQPQLVGMPGAPPMAPQPQFNPFGEVSAIPLPRATQQALRPQMSGPRDISTRGRPEPEPADDEPQPRIERMIADELDEVEAPARPVAAKAKSARGRRAAGAQVEVIPATEIDPNLAGRAAALEGFDAPAAPVATAAPGRAMRPQAVVEAAAPEAPAASGQLEEAEVYHAGTDTGAMVNELGGGSADEGTELLAGLIDNGSKEDLVQLATKMGVKADRRLSRTKLQQKLREKAGLAE